MAFDTFLSINMAHLLLSSIPSPRKLVAEMMLCPYNDLSDFGVWTTTSPRLPRPFDLYRSAVVFVRNRLGLVR